MDCNRKKNSTVNVTFYEDILFSNYVTDFHKRKVFVYDLKKLNSFIYIY